MEGRAQGRIELGWRHGGGSRGSRRGTSVWGEDVWREDARGQK